MKQKSQIIAVQNIDVSIRYDYRGDEFISLTDIARFKNPEEPKIVNANWMRNRSTIEFPGLWEKLRKPDFKGIEFDTFLYEAGSNAFTLTPTKWIEATNAKGVTSKAGFRGGTFAHRDIALEFASWVSAELTKAQVSLVYASEADVLNMALFGITAKHWREANRGAKGNIRDHADVSQLVCLWNLESLNAELIEDGLPQSERLRKLNKTAIRQMKRLTDDHRINRLGGAK